MDVDFSNSRNATILHYLQNPYDFIMGPKAGLFREARRRHGADHEDDHRAEPPRGAGVARSDEPSAPVSGRRASW